MMHEPCNHLPELGDSPEPAQSSDYSTAYELRTDTVSPIFNCKTNSARKLCLYDIAEKLKRSSDYDIGGTYSDVPEFWFLYKTSFSPGRNYLLSLYVCSRIIGNFSVGVCHDIDCTKYVNYLDGKSTYCPKLSWHSFRCLKKNELFHIKTYCFCEIDVIPLKCEPFYLPVEIKTNVSSTISTELVNKFKSNHSIGQLLYKMDNKDFKLISSSGKAYPAHRIVLAAHSPYLRALVKDSQVESAKCASVSDEELELVLEFIYTGEIKDILKIDCSKLIPCASLFKLRSMFVLIQHTIEKQINVDTAVQVAILAYEFNLDDLLKGVFIYIRDNPKVLMTDAWKKLDNVALTKKMFEYIYLNELPSPKTQPCVSRCKSSCF